MILFEDNLYEYLNEVNLEKINDFDLIKDPQNCIVRAISGIPIILNGNHINQKNVNDVRFPPPSIRKYVTITGANNWIEHAYEILNRTFNLKAGSNSIKPHIDNIFYNKYPDFSKIVSYDEKTDDLSFKLALYSNLAYDDPNTRKRRLIRIEAALAICASILSYDTHPLCNVDITKRSGPEGVIAKSVLNALNRYKRTKNDELIPLSLYPVFLQTYTLFVSGYCVWVKELNNNLQYRTDLQSDNINHDVDQNGNVKNEIIDDAYTVHKSKNIILSKDDIKCIPLVNDDFHIINEQFWNKLLAYEFNRKVSNSIIKNQKGAKKQS